MEGMAELAFGIAALVYGVGLALFRLPMLQVRRWGWTLMMHSWSGVVVFTLVGSLAVLKGVMANYVSDMGFGWALGATFDDAIESARASRDMAFAWANALNFAALALGMLQSLIMLALIPTWISGVGVLFSAIASYIFGAVFGALLFMQKILAGVILFMEGVVAFVGMMSVLAPAMFAAGLVLFMIPFARRLGKTFIVMGAILTLALPVAIVAASPPPGYADRKIMEAADVQAVSIASKAVAEEAGGVRYTVYDRENESLWHPFMLAEPLGEPNVDRAKVCSNIPRGANITCDQLVEMVKEVLKTPEKAILDTGGGGYYNAYEEGYRTTMTNNTFSRRVWFLNMWVILHDAVQKDITVYRIPDKPDPEAVECAKPDEGPRNRYGGSGGPSACHNIYQMWRDRWEEFWRSTELYNETSEWMVAENRNSTFVWFTEQPWGTPKEDLNKYEVKVQKERESRWEECVRWEDDDNDPETPDVCTLKRYYTQAYYHGNKSVYFVYLNMSDWEVCWDLEPLGPIGGGRICETRKGSPDWSYRVYDLHGPKEKYQPKQIEIVDERFRHNATIGGFECGGDWVDGVFDSHFEEMKQEGFIEDYGPYTLEQGIQAVDRDEPLTLDAPTEEKKVVVEVTIVCTAWSYAGYPILPSILTFEFRVDFTASESMPYLPPVEWQKFDDDERYMRELAAGKYVPDSIMGVTLNNMRQEWARYQNFRQGLYRDGPSQEAVRRVNAKLLEYREKSWETNATILDSNIPISKAVSDIIYEQAYGQYAGSNIPILSHMLLITESGAVGILKPLADLIGQSFAIGLAIGLIALVIDTFQAFVGGQSVMVGFLMSKVGNISMAARFLGQFTSAVNRLAGASILGRAMARRMENQLLKAALEQRRLDRNRWDRLAERRSQVQARVALMERMLGRERLERMLDSRNPLAQAITRGYALSVAHEGLRDPAFKASAEKLMSLEMLEKRGLLSRLDSSKISPSAASKFLKAVSLSDHPKVKGDTEKVVRGLSQSGSARMTPEQWAEGFASMMKNPNLTAWEKVALADSLARSNPGEAIVKSTLAAPAGLAVKALGEQVEKTGAKLDSEKLTSFGMLLESFGRGIDGHIKAPAAFQIGAAEPWAEKGAGVTVPQGYVPDSRVDWKTFTASPAEAVVRREDVGGSFEDVSRAKSFVEVFGSSDDIKKFESNENLRSLMEAVHPPSDGSLAGYAGQDYRPDDRAVAEAFKPGTADDKTPTLHDAGKQDVEGFTTTFEPHEVGKQAVESFAGTFETARSDYAGPGDRVVIDAVLKNETSDGSEKYPVSYEVGRGDVDAFVGWLERHGHEAVSARSVEDAVKSELSIDDIQPVKSGPFEGEQLDTLMDVKSDSVDSSKLDAFMGKKGGGRDE